MFQLGKISLSGVVRNGKSHPPGEDRFLSLFMPGFFIRLVQQNCVL
jgi:hypothetical protein